MNKWKGVAILFTILSFGALKESWRIFTSADADVANNRTGLIPIAIIGTGIFVFFAIRFWLKSTRNR